MFDSTLIHGLFNAARLNETLSWNEYDQPGRTGVMIHTLYDTTEDEPVGPKAALVRYRPGARVLRHRHPGYELILVLDGELINSGRHGPGTLEICPPGSSHALSSETGCTFLVVWEQPVTPDRSAWQQFDKDQLSEAGA